MTDFSTSFCCKQAAWPLAFYGPGNPTIFKLSVADQDAI